MTRVHLRQIRDRLQTGYWFTPLVMAALAALLAQFMLRLDAQIPNEALAKYRLVSGQDTEQVRSMLISLAGTVLSTAAVVFTLLTLPLSMAASQFGSRLLRLYLRDRTTQIVLGVFVGTFTYCLRAALAIPPAVTEPDAPQLTATVAQMLSLAAFASLLVLIQHIAVSLQAPSVAASASAELADVIHALARRPRHRSAVPLQDEEETLVALIEREGRPIVSGGMGYIKAIDTGQAVVAARARNLLIRFVCKSGDFVKTGDRIALVWPPQSADPRVIRRVGRCLRLGKGRTPTEDIGYAINQLVEMAVRAMSAAINDPYTAMTCLDYLGAGLALYAERAHPQPYYYDLENHLRVIVEPLAFGQVLDTAFHMIRRAGRNDPDVLLSLLGAIEKAAVQPSTAERRAELLRHVRLVQAESQAGSSIVCDQERVSRRCAELAATLSEARPEPERAAGPQPSDQRHHTGE